jgi:tRNA pseudouridine55 synthase
VIRTAKTHSRRVDGLLLLDKDTGLTSNAALQKAKRLYRASKAGHTGSLDPLASGLLPVCLGEATKLSGFLLGSDKRYRVRIRLGVTTTTMDSDGEIVETRPVPLLDVDKLELMLNQFRGDILGTQAPGTKALRVSQKWSADRTATATSHHS